MFILVSSTPRAISTYEPIRAVSGLNLEYRKVPVTAEKILTPGNLSTVVLKVYGYRDAIGDYSVGFSCR